MTESSVLIPEVAVETAPHPTRTLKSYYDYEFPYSESFRVAVAKLSSLTTEALINHLHHYSYDLKDESGKRLNYEGKVRNSICAFNIALNIQGLIAPRFRPTRKPPAIGKTKYPIEDEYLSNDRQIADLHWVHTKKMSVSRIVGFSKLANHDDDFDWALASRFVRVYGKATRKAEALGLSDYDLVQLSTIQSSAIKSGIRSVESAVQKNSPLLRTALSLAGSRYSPDALAAIPYLYQAMLIAGSSPLKASQAYQFITGDVISAKTMGRHINRFTQALKDSKRPDPVKSL